MTLSPWRWVPEAEQPLIPSSSPYMWSRFSTRTLHSQPSPESFHHPIERGQIILNRPLGPGSGQPTLWLLTPTRPPARPAVHRAAVPAHCPMPSVHSSVLWKPICQAVRGTPRPDHCAAGSVSVVLASWGPENPQRASQGRLGRGDLWARGSLWGQNIQAPFLRGNVIESMHMQKAQLTSPKCLQAFMHETQHEQFRKSHQDPLDAGSEDTLS